MGELLGKGAFGYVYAGVRNEDGKQVNVLSDHLQEIFVQDLGTFPASLFLAPNITTVDLY